MKSKNKPEKTINPSFNLDSVLDNLKGYGKDTVFFAKARWEFLRRNKDFISAIENMDNESPDFSTIMLAAKWNIWPMRLKPDQFNIARDKERLREYLGEYMNSDCSFDEQIYFLCNKLRNENADFTDIDLLLWSITNWIQCIAPNSFDCIKVKRHEGDSGINYFQLISFDESFPESFKQDGILNISIDLKFSKSQLLDNLGVLIRACQQQLGAGKKKKVRTRHNYDLYPLYLKAYDLREQQKLTYKKIAIAVMPKDYETDPKGAEEKVRQYCNEAERLIAKVAEL